MNQSSNRRNTRTISLQARLALSFTLLTMLLSGLVLYFLYHNVAARTRDELRVRLRDMAALAAQQVDATAHAALTGPSMAADPLYLEVKRSLQRIREAGTGIRSVYTLRRTIEGSIIFVVDAETDPTRMASLGEVYAQAGPALLENIETMTGPVVEPEIYTGEDGSWISGYAPFYTPDGRREGIIGIDIAASEVLQAEQQMLWNFLGLYLALAPVSALAGWFVGRLFTNPLRRLTESAARIASGDLSQQIRSTAQDEIGRLGEAINLMTLQFRTQIETLERRMARRTAMLEQRSSYLEASVEVGRAAASLLDSDSLIDQVVHLILERFNLYYVGLFLMDETDEWAVLAAGTGEAGRAMLSRGHRIRSGTGMIGWCVANAKPRVAMEAGEDYVRQVNPELPGTRSEAALPLRSRGRVIGALSVQSARANAFDEDTVRVLQNLADQVAVAIDNARLFTESQEALEASRRAYREASRQAWEALSGARPDWGYRYNRQTVAPATGPWQPEMVQAVQDGRSLIQGGSLSTPIRVRNEVIGVLTFRKKNPTDPWTRDEVETIETLIEQVGQAIDSARLYQETQQRALREQITGEVTARIRESLDIESMLKTAVREVQRALELPEVTVHLGAQDF